MAVTDDGTRAGLVAAPAQPAAGAQPRARALLAPLAAAAGGLPALAYLWAVSPEQPGHYPLCPLYWATGIYCPGCGTLRAAHALLHGDLATALHRNVLVVLAAPLVALLWLEWTARAARGRPARRLALSTPATVVVVVLLVAYGVLRNLPWGAFLAP
ncbi:MAG: DUF2752 domain-containing protein [Motilibacteraceae bacterium]